MVRLGSKLTFGEAVKEIWYAHRTTVPEATLRRTTHKHGQAAEEIDKEKTAELERRAPASKAKPDKLLMSTDGAFIHTTTGEWVEVKTVAVGDLTLGNNKNKPKTTDISYFSRKYDARTFEKYALSELHRRGIDNASLVVSVNDGSSWIQNFIAYHCPEAQRINDFAHSVGYLASAGKAIYGEGETFEKWFKRTRRTLKDKPPRETIGALNLLKPKAKNDEAIQDVGVALHYLETRMSLIDYAHFQKQGYPIGSGMVESSHKVVVHKRMKGAGMRWGNDNINGMLALRNLVCNDRWEEGWAEIMSQPQPRYKRKAVEELKVTEPTEGITFAKIEVEKGEGKTSQEKRSQIPDANHPWRNNKWPSYEKKWLN